MEETTEGRMKKIKRLRKKKERSGYSLGGPAAFLAIMPYK